MWSTGQTLNQDAEYKAVCKILEGTSQPPPSAVEYDQFAMAIKNKDGKQVEDCIKKWCPIASGCSKFSAFLKMLLEAMQQGPENAAALQDQAMVIHVFRGLWHGFYLVAVQFELNSLAGGFGELIGETVGIIEVIDEFESLFLNRVTFQHLKQHLLLLFAQRWSSMAQNCNLDAKLRNQLPWHEVKVCLSSDLVSLWAYRQADEIRHGLLTKLLELQRVVNLDSNILKAKLRAFEAGLSMCIANMGEPTTVNKHLTGNLKKFKGILDSYPLCKPTPRATAKQKAPNAKRAFDELEMMNDMKSVKRILHYLSLAKSVRRADHTDSDDDVLLCFLLVERVLQVAGECLKNTAGSANLSENKRQALKKAGVPLEMLSDLRNALSHYNGLSVQRKRQAETSFSVSKVFHDLGKLEVVFNKVLHRIELNLLKKLIEGERSQLAMGCQDAQLLNWLAECQTTAELEGRLSNAATATPFSKKLQFLIQQFNVYSEVLGMEGLFSEGDGTPNGKDISEIFKQLLVDGKVVCKSSITEVSDMNNLRMFSDDISLMANKVQQRRKCGNIVIERNDHLGKLVSTVVQKNMSAEFYSSVSGELFLGSGFPVAKTTIETVLQSYDDTVLSMAEMSHMVLVLQLLDAVLNVTGGDVRSTSAQRDACYVDAVDDFVDLVAEAPFDPVKAEKVERIADAIGLTNKGVQDVLLGVLLDMCQGATGAGCDVDLLVSKVVRENCSLQNVRLVNESKENNEIKSARLNLMQLRKRRVNKEPDQLTEPEFLHYRDKFNEHLEKSGNSNQFRSTFEDGSNRVWESDLKLLKNSASPYEKLTTSLQRTKSLEESCTVFLRFLTDLGIPVDERDSAVCLFRSLEQKSLESFVSDRISQLAKLLAKYEIPLEKSGDLKALVDKTWSSYKSNHQLQAAVEMILLECLEILENLYRPPVSFKYQSGNLLTDKTFGNISLRNYLAHGDALLDLYNPEVCRLILDNAIELATNGERVMALRKLFEEPKIFEFFWEAEKEGKLHTVHAANVSSLTDGDVQETLSTLQRDAGWETVVKKCLIAMSTSNCITPARELAGATGTSVDLPTKLMSEDALYMLLGNDVRQFQFLIEMNSQICKHRFRDDWTILHYVLYQMQDAANVIELLVNAGADVNAMDDQHLRPLHIAVLRHSMPNLEALLSYQDLDVNVATVLGITPMHMATQLGYGDSLEVLLKMGADPNVQTHSCWFPLHFASSNGQHDVVELLLRYAAKANIIGFDKWSPLHLAVKSDHVDVAEILLEHNADVHARLDDNPLTGGRSVVHLAACYGSVKVMRLLLNRGVDADAESSDNYGLGRIPLHWAALYGRQEMVECLAALPGVEKNKEDLQGSTALDYALMNHHLPIATFLMQQGWRHKPNVLVAAAALGDIGLLTLLEEQGADLNVEVMSMTPATIAASYGRLEVLKYITAKTETDVEALMHAACQYGKSNIVKFLVEERHYPNIDQWLKPRQETPLHAAAAQGRLSVVQYLVEKCAADKEAMDSDGNTPCVRAVKCTWNLAVANYLLENGADVGREKGHHMLSLAASRGQWDLVKKLIERGADFNAPCGGPGESVAVVAACHGHVVMLSFLIEDRGYDVQRLNVPSFLQRISETGKGHVLHYLHCRGLELRTPFADSGALGFHFAAAAGNTEACDFFLNDLRVGIDLADCAGLTPLHYAAKGNRPHVVKYLLARNANATLRSNLGDTPLRLATKELCWQVVKSIVEGTASTDRFLDEEGNTLLHLCLKASSNRTVAPVELQYCNDKLGARIFHRNNAGNTVLHEAACSDAGVLNFILTRAKEASTGPAFEDFLNGKDANGNSALILYVKSYRPKMDKTYQRALEVFIQHGVDLNVQDTNRQTALHLAVAKNSKDLLIALMVPLTTYRETNNVKGHCIANPFVVDQSGLTPLMLQQKLKMDRCGKVLLLYESDYKRFFLKDGEEDARLDAGYKKYVCSRLLMDNPLSFHVLRSDRESVAGILNSTSEWQFAICNGKLPIHDAAAVGNVQVLELLIAAGSDINAGNKFLETPLHLAAYNGHRDVVEWLLSHGAKHDASNVEGNKPVHCAIKTGCVDVVDYFFKRGLSDINDWNESDQSPLVVAAGGGHNACIEYLLQRYEEGEEPLGNPEVLNEAVMCRKLNTVRLLLEKGALSSVVNVGKRHKSPLYLSVKNEEWAIALLLLETALDEQLPFLLAGQGTILLDDACSYGQFEVVKYLVERGGIDPNSTLEDGRTPLIGAVYSRSKQVVEYLLKRSANPNAFLRRTKETPLHIAAKRGYGDIAKILIDNHASIFEISYLRNPLGTAAAGGHWDVAVIILNSAGPHKRQVLNDLTTLELEALKTYADEKDLADELFTCFYNFRNIGDTI